MAKYELRRTFLRDTAAATAGLSLGVSSLSTACTGGGIGGSSSIKLKRDGRSISISLPSPGNVPEVEVRLLSDANNYIFEYDDVSPHAPKADNEQTREVWLPDYDARAEARRQSSREQRFPVVDVVLKRGMEAVIEIDLNGPGEYNLNGHGMNPITKEIRIPDGQVEHWGNSLILNPKSNSIQSFYLASTVEGVDSNVTFEFETLRDDWVGLISVHDVGAKELIASTAVSWDTKLPQISTGSGVTRHRMIESLSWATKFILGCENTNPDSETYGGEFLLYDLAAKTRLRSEWSWAWGPSAKMLLAASTTKGVDVGVSSEQLLRRAVDLGHATLRKQILDPSHPAYGVLRTSSSVASTVDTLFLVGWGWMPLYKATGDRLYLEAAEKVADAAKRLMDEYEDIMIPQSFNLRRKTWSNMMSFESSMGLPGLAALYMTTGNEHHRDIMVRLADLLINAFEQEDGLWGVFFSERTRQASPANYWTKALGYCVDGLIEAHRAAPDRGYLKKAIRITEHVLNAQAPDGSWAVRLDRSAEYVGICDKSTALWPGLLIRLYKLTGDKVYLTAGTKALEWCMDHQYFGDDTIARGAIVGRSWPSGITFRHWFDVVVTYTVSFFGNSLTEALSLDEWK
jgi:hypothetical protein